MTDDRRPTTDDRRPRPRALARVAATERDGGIKDTMAGTSSSSSSSIVATLTSFVARASRVDSACSSCSLVGRRRRRRRRRRQRTPGDGDGDGDLSAVRSLSLERGDGGWACDACDRWRDVGGCDA